MPGSSHLGHIEMLGALTGSDRYATMFIVGDLKIFFATRHMSLREALDHLTRQSLTRAIQESWTALEVLGHDPPRLAVAALNPHGGEGGNFGEEEIKLIGPACEQARRFGRAVDGPIPCGVPGGRWPAAPPRRPATRCRAATPHPPGTIRPRTSLAPAGRRAYRIHQRCWCRR